MDTIVKSEVSWLCKQEVIVKYYCNILFWDLVLNGWHSVGQNRCAWRLPLFSYSLYVSFSLSHLMVSADSNIRGRLTVDILLSFTVLSQIFFSCRERQTQPSGEKKAGGKNRKMEVSGRVTWHTGCIGTVLYLWFLSKKTELQVERATDRFIVIRMRQDCYCINNDSCYH